MKIVQGERLRITSIRFRNYKAFEDYSISLGPFSVIVGPNNSGKSTVLGAIRILSEGIRRGRSKKPELINGPKGHQVRAHPISLQGLPVSTENVFHDYEESTPATIDFRLANGASLCLFFPERGQCYLVPVDDLPSRSPSEFKRHFNVDIAFVPTLGPLEHEEPLVIERAIRKRLASLQDSGSVPAFNENAAELLMRLTDSMKNMVQARLVASRHQFERTIQSGLHAVTISEAAMNDFDEKWGRVEARMRLVPGKEVLSALNGYLQSHLRIALSAFALIEAFTRPEVPASLADLLVKLDEMRTAAIPERPVLCFEST